MKTDAKRINFYEKFSAIFTSFLLYFTVGGFGVGW